MNNEYPVLAERFVVTIFTNYMPDLSDVGFEGANGLIENIKTDMNSNYSTVPMRSLVLTRGVFQGISQENIIREVENKFWDTKISRKDLLITYHDINCIPKKAWGITNAELESWSWGRLNEESDDAMLETMEFRYNEIQSIEV